MSAYEIRVIVSAQDHFSSAFGRISNDLNRMGRAQKKVAVETSRLNKELAKTTKLRRSELLTARSVRSNWYKEEARLLEQLTKQEKALADAIIRRNKAYTPIKKARQRAKEAGASVRAADAALVAAGEPTPAQLRRVRNARLAMDNATEARRAHVQEKWQARRAARMAAQDRLQAARTNLRDVKGRDEFTQQDVRDAERQIKKAEHALRGKSVKGPIGVGKQLKARAQQTARDYVDAFNAAHGTRDLSKLKENADFARERRKLANATVRDLESANTARNVGLKGMREQIVATKALQAAHEASATSMFRDTDALRASAKARGLTEKELTGQLVKQQEQMQKLTDLERKRNRMRAIGHGGRVATLAGGIGLAGAGGLANYAANFSREVTLAATQTPGSISGVPQIMKNAEIIKPQVIDLIKTFGFASEEINKSVYDMFSSIRLEGPKAMERGMNLVRIASMAAVGGLTDLESTTTATIVMANQFGDSFETIAANMNTAFAIVKYGNMQFSDFTAMLTKVGPAAAAAGFSLKDVGGIMAFMTKKSGKPQEAATWIVRLMQVFQTPEFLQGMKLLNAPISDRGGKLQKFTSAVKQVNRLIFANKGRPGLSMSNIIASITSYGKHGNAGGAGNRSTIQAARGMTFSLLDEKGLAKDTKNVLNDQRAFMDSFLSVYNDAGSKWKRQLAGFKAAALEIGIALLPPMTKLVGMILTVVNAFSSLSPSIKRVIAIVIVLGSTLLLFGGVLISVIAGLASFGIALTLVGVEMSAAAIMTAGLTAGIWGLVAATLALGAAKVFTDMNKQRREHRKRYEVYNSLTQKQGGTTIPIGGLGVGGLGQSITIGGKKPKVTDEQQSIIDRVKKGYISKDFGEQLLRKTIPAIKKTTKELSTLDKFIRLVEEAKKTGDSRELEKQLKAQSAAANKAGRDAYKAFLNQTAPQKDDVASRRANEIVTAQKDILKRASDGLMNMYKEMKTKNETLYGELFAGPVSQSAAVQWRKSFGVQMNVPEMLADMKAQFAQFNKMRSQAATLKKRGLSQDIIDTVMAMPREEAVPKLAALMGASPKDIAQFNSYMRGKKKVIVEATEIDFQTQLDKWKSFGATAALNIAAGFESEENGVNTRMVALADRLWSSVAGVMAAAQVVAQYGPVVPPGVDPATQTLPRSTTGIGAISAAAYQANQTAHGWNINNPNLRRANPNVGDMIAEGGNVTKPALPGVNDPSRSLTSHTTVNNFNVNGVFYTPEQVMDNAMRAAAYKGMRGRKN
jgi:TP901 family phage tail tape measure protein